MPPLRPDSLPGIQNFIQPALPSPALSVCYSVYIPYTLHNSHTYLSNFEKFPILSPKSGRFGSQLSLKTPSPLFWFLLTCTPSPFMRSVPRFECKFAVSGPSLLELFPSNSLSLSLSLNSALIIFTFQSVPTFQS